MKTQDFRYRAIAFLRDDMSIDTHCLPHDVIEDDAGVATIDGEWVRPCTGRRGPMRGGRPDDPAVAARIPRRRRVLLATPTKSSLD